MAFSDKPIDVLICLGGTASDTLELYETAQKEFPGHAVTLIDANTPPNPSMEKLENPLVHFGVPVAITWRVMSGWGDYAHPDTADWVMRNWSPHLYLPREDDVNEVEEIADLDAFDRELEKMDIGNNPD